MIELFINGERADVEQRAFSYTLQVSDLFNFDTREVSYSETVYLPATVVNRRIFGFADLVTADSVGAYVEYSVDYVVNGIPIVQGGVGYLRGKRGDNYIFDFKDRSKELYGYLQNRDIKGIKGFLSSGAERTLANINNQHGGDYQSLMYLVGNYGDDMVIEDGDSFLEYWFDNTPLSIALHYIFGLVAADGGFTFEGDIFRSDDFRQAYIATSNMKYNDIAEGEKFEGNVQNLTFDDYARYGYVNGAFVANGGVPYVAKEDGYYRVRIEIKGLRAAFNHPAAFSRGYLVGFLYDSPVTATTTAHDFSYDELVWLRKGEELYPYLGSRYYRSETRNFIVETGRTVADSVRITIFKPKRNDSVKELVTDFQLIDLFKEVFKFFALTPIRNRDTGAYHFYTLKERVNAPVVDWSDKLLRVTEEVYHNGVYGQRNNFTYKKYDNENGYRQSEGDGRLLFEDRALVERKDFEGKFYSPLNEYIQIKGDDANIWNFEFYTKELKKDGNGAVVTEYREKTARWHIFKARRARRSLKFRLRLSSEEVMNRGVYYFADFSDFRWQRRLELYYRDLPRLMGKAYIVRAEVALTELDVYSFSFFSRIFINKLGGYFMPNKIEYRAGGVSLVELIRIN